MEDSFSWKSFHRWANTLQSIGFVFLVIGPLIGVLLMIFGDLILKGVGLAMIFSSILICLYHISFCLLMNAIEAIKDQLKPDTSSDRVEYDESSVFPAA